MISGVTSTGFVRPPIDEIETYVEGIILSLATDPSGNEPNMIAPEPYGVIKGIGTTLYDNFIQELEKVYYDLFILTASGTALDDRAYPTIRLSPTKSTGALTFTGGTPGEAISHSVLFETEDGRQYQLINDLLIDLYGEATGEAQSVLTGLSQNAPISSVRFIPVPVSGMPLLQVTNNAAFLNGTDVETDEAFRARAVANNSIEKTSSLPAMESAIRQLTGVTACVGYENLTDVADVDGVPPGGIVMSVQGGTDLDIATSIYNKKPAGNPSWGTTTQNVTDPINGVIYPMRFSRVSNVLIYVSAVKTVDETYNAAVSDDVIRQRILDYIGGVNPSSVTSPGVTIGEDVYAWKAASACFELSNPNMIPGLLKLVVLIGTATGDRTHESVVISSAQEAYTDFASIAVT